MTCKFVDSNFPQGGKGPSQFFVWDKDRKRAWWDETNRRASPNDEDPAAAAADYLANLKNDP